MGLELMVEELVVEVRRASDKVMAVVFVFDELVLWLICWYAA